METKNLFELNSFHTNDYEIEQTFRETCLWYENKFFISDKTYSKAYQNYINNYQKVKSLYLIIKDGNNRTQLIVYDTENEREEVKTLITSIVFDSGTCITLLPNGELFCFCKFKNQDKALIIENNYDFRLLPSPSDLSIIFSSAIYFNASVYCFGGADKFFSIYAWSRKFDFNENRWINLTPMPKADYRCHSLIFKENILICGCCNKNLLLYSVDIDSFSTIPYEFSQSIRKILINAEKLYLIECLGPIYESEVENEFAWNKISHSIILDPHPFQMLCLYNKGKIYISEISNIQKYFKFDLKQKIMSEL